MAEIPARPKVLALDLDGTLLAYKHAPDIGEPLPGMKQVVDALKAIGWKIAIWTCRDDHKQIKEILSRHEIPFDWINENPLGPPTKSPKIYADVYLDDRALQFEGDMRGLLSQIVGHVPWYKRNPIQSDV